MFYGFEGGAVFAESEANVPAKPFQKIASDKRDSHRSKSHTSSSKSHPGSSQPPKKLVPTQFLSTTAPEIVLGSIASRESSLFIAAVVCSYIMTGKYLLKSGNAEQKYLQYLYR